MPVAVSRAGVNEVSVCDLGGTLTGKIFHSTRGSVENVYEPPRRRRLQMSYRDSGSALRRTERTLTNSWRSCRDLDTGRSIRIREKMIVGLLLQCFCMSPQKSYLRFH